MINEIWRPVKNYERFYEVSNLGRVKSLARKGTGGKERILKKSIDSYGYEIVSLSVGNNNKTRTVHRLAAQAFIENPENKPQINHKNGIKTGNYVENLEWATAKENSIHAHRVLGLQNGENAPSAKINKKIADRIREEYIPRKISRVKLSRKYSVNKSTIDRVLANKVWL